MEKNYFEKNRENGRIIGGLILVGVGAALLLRNTGFPLPYWLFTWPVILILIGIYSGFKHNFKNSTWMILLAIGGFFLIDKIVPGLRITPYFWPIFIIAAGVIFIIRPRRNTWNDGNEIEKETANYPLVNNSTTITSPGSMDQFDRTDFVKVESVFSGVKRNILSKNFQGGTVACVFGGADIDLTQADIKGKVDIKFDVVFGGAKIIIPPHWKVFNEIEGAFHGVDDKRKYSTDVTNSDKMLILRGTVVFGGIDIKSY